MQKSILEVSKPKNIIIIGGGIAGLTAGIYALQNGYGATIYEKNLTCGGMCIGWKRKDYTIDNCVHWLTGTSKDNKLYKIWENVGVLGDDIELIRPDYFYSSELNGQVAHLWRDLEKTRQEMLAISPEDEQEINKFIKYTDKAKIMQIPTDKPMDLLNLFEFTKLGISMLNISKVAKVYGDITVSELADRFKHPLLRCLIRDCISSNYLAFSLLVSYGTFIAGNGDIPKGGSIKMIERMVQRFESLGGKVYTNVSVKKIVVENDQAVGIEIGNHEFIPGDYVIAACDTDFTFNKLLDKKYMNKKLQRTYSEEDDLNPIGSSFHVAFSVDGTFDEIDHYRFLDCKPISVGGQKITRFSIKNYRNYGEMIAPMGKTVIQSTFNQDDSDFKYWSKLYSDRSEYRDIKEYLAEETLKRIEDHYPKYKGKINILDKWSPITYSRYCNAYKGSYMGFVNKKNVFKRIFTGKLKGLPNVFLASQWLMAPGGLPVAMLMGKFAIQYVNEDNKHRK